MQNSFLKIASTVITNNVDTATGEILDTDVKHHKYLANTKEEFLLVYSSLLSAFIEMTQSQIRVYAYLLRYASGNSFAITKALREEMSKEINVNARVIFTTVKELVVKNLIVKMDGLYKVNPRYAFKGSTLDRNEALKVIIELGCKEC